MDHAVNNMDAVIDALTVNLKLTGIGSDGASNTSLISNDQLQTKDVVEDYYYKTVEPTSPLLQENICKKPPHLRRFSLINAELEKSKSETRQYRSCQINSKRSDELLGKDSTSMDDIQLDRLNEVSLMIHDQNARYKNSVPDDVPFEDSLNSRDIYRIQRNFLEKVHEKNAKVSLESFIEIVDKALRPIVCSRSDIELLFTHSDTFNEGKISWRDTISYLGDKFLMGVGDSAKKDHSGFQMPPHIVQIRPNLHGYLELVSIVEINDNYLLMTSVTGVVTEWDLNKEVMIAIHYPNPKFFYGKKMKVLDVFYISIFGKICIATGGSEILIFETRPIFNFICKISKLTSVPIKLTGGGEPNGNGLLCYGDYDGCINCLTFKDFSGFLPNLRGYLDIMKQTIIFSDLISSGKVGFYHWKVHNTLVFELRYIESLNAVVSSATEKLRALVVGSVPGKKRVGQYHIQLSQYSTDYTVAKSPKKERKKNAVNFRTKDDEIMFSVVRGVTAFDFSKISRYFATGGPDNILRIWNVDMKGIAMKTHRLIGHCDKFVLIRFHEDHEKLLLSMSRDIDIRLWDSVTFEMLYSLQPYDYVIDPKIALKSVVFSSKSGKLYFVSDNIYTLVIQKPKQDYHLASDIHKCSVTALLYRPWHNTIISGDQKGVIKMWDICNGKFIGEFLLSKEERSPVTSLLMDYLDVRLMSSHEDGLIRVWNLSTYQCIKIYRKNNTATVTTMIYKNFFQFRWLVSAGWDRQLQFYSGLQVNTTLHQDPIFFLIDKAYYPYEGNVMMKGHIQCMVEGPQSRVIIGCDDGEIHVWDVLGRKMIKCLVMPPPADFIPDSICHASVDLRIHRMFFLWTRYNQKVKSEGAVFVTLGPYNLVHFWSRLVSDGKLLASFFPTLLCKSFSYCMDVTDDNRLLYTADVRGNVFIWDISEYAKTSMPEQNPPPLKNFWSAHTLPVTDMKILPGPCVIATCSVDCSIKLWQLNGSFIGVFGQIIPWDLEQMTESISSRHFDRPEERRSGTNLNNVSEKIVSETMFDTKKVFLEEINKIEIEHGQQESLHRGESSYHGSSSTLPSIPVSSYFGESTRGTTSSSASITTTDDSSRSYFEEGIIGSRQTIEVSAVRQRQYRAQLFVDSNIGRGVYHAVELFGNPKRKLVRQDLRS